MGKVKFTPPRGKGYSNIPDARLMVAQLKESFEKKEAEDKEQLRERKQQDRIAAADIEAVKAKEERNLKDINMDDSIFSTQERAINNNLKTEIANDKANRAAIGNENDTLRAVLEYAPTAWKNIQSNQKKDWEATMEGAYNYHMQHGLEEEQLIRLELIEDSNWTQGQGFEEEANRMQQEGYQPKEVEWVRFKNKASDYGRLKAYWHLAAKDYVPTLKQELIKRGITDPAAMRAFAKDFDIQYLKSHNLYDPSTQKSLSTDFMGKGLETIAEQKAALFNRAENIQAFDVAKKRAEDFGLVLQDTINAKIFNPELSGQAVNEAFAEQKKRWNEQTGDVFSNQEAIDATVKMFEDVTKFPDDTRVEAAFMAAQGKDNWYTQRIPALMNKRAENRKKIEENKAALAQAQFDSDTAKVDKFFNPTAEDIKNGTGFNGSKEAAQNTIDYLVKRYPKRLQDIQDKYGKYLEWTPAGRLDGDWATGHYNDKYDNVRITSEDLNSDDIPPEFKSTEFRMEVARREKILGQANYEDRWQKGIENALTNALVEDDMKRGGKIDESFEGAAYHAETRFRQCVIGPGGDAESCAKAITAEIETKTGDFTVGYYGKGKNRRAGSFFEKFSATASGPSKLAINDFTTLNGEEADEAVNQVEAENHMIHNRLYLKPKQLEEIHNAIANGHPFRYPRILKRIADLNPEYFGSQYDVFKSQVEVAKRMGVLDKKFDKETGDQTRGALNMHTFMKAWHRQTDDPNARKFITNLSTLDDARKGITLAWRPESKAEPQFMSETVAEQITAQPVDPVFLVDPTAPEYQFNPGIASEINKMIAVSKGAVNKDEILYDGNFIRTNGNTTEYFKLKGEENGYKYWPGEGWYKFDIR